MSRISSMRRFVPTRNRDGSALSLEQLRAYTPSVFADGAHESRSDRYSHVPTSQVLAALASEGFQPFFAAQAVTRDEGKREHAKHMLRLRHASQIGSEHVNEIILVNSHDGSSSYQMLGGVFRFVCANGLVCGHTSSEIRIPHKGDVIDRVTEGALEVLDGFQLITEKREAMQGVRWNAHEQQAFAAAALSLRYSDEDAHTPIDPGQLLTPRRADDRGDDAWRVFNRVQENVIKGGLRGHDAKKRTTSTREVKGIGQNLSLNRAMWVLAEQLKAVAADPDAMLDQLAA